MIDIRRAGADVTADGESTVHETGTADQLRTSAATLARGLPPGRTVIGRPGLAGERLAAFVEGLVLGDYHYSLKTSAPRERRRVEIAEVDDDAAIEQALLTATATVWARDLVNTPAATKTPAWLAEQARQQLTPLGVHVRIYDERWLAAQHFGGVLAVGGAAAAPPRLIEAAWRPRRAASDRHLVLVGKGITFDTGGLQIKPADGMKTMKTDMAGGAAVLAALRIVAARRLPVRVTALVPAAENAVGAASYRPGDVVRHVGGRTSEITNTDAEGRIILADALAYAVARLHPSALVDVATLTGAMKIALGLRTGGLFATDDALADELLSAATATGEPLWRMPLVDDYERSLDSPVADANNAPGNPGAITAALFLRPFAGSVPWAHLDIAGPARAAKDDGPLSQGGTGFGARLLASWVASLA